MEVLCTHLKSLEMGSKLQNSFANIFFTLFHDLQSNVNQKMSGQRLISDIPVLQKI